MLLDNFFAMVAESMESNSNSTINNSNAKGGSTMENSKRNAKAKAHNSNSNSKRNAKAHNAKVQEVQEVQEVQQETATPTLPDTMPAVANAGISAKGMEQDTATSLLFQYHIRQGLAAYGGACTICQLYNFLRGDNPLRLEKDGTPKADNLPRWRGLGSSKLFRANTQGTLLEYTNKVCANGRIRSIVKAGPMLQEFPAAK